MMKKLCTALLVWGMVINVYAQQPTKEPIKIGDETPKVVLQNLSGEDIFLSDYCGKKLRQPWKNTTKYVVILSFFTTYCQPCQKEIPELEKLVEKYAGKNLKIFLINLKEEKELVNKCILDRSYKLPVLLDKYGMTAEKYGVTSVPRIFLIDREGTIAWMTKGYEGDFNEKIVEELNKQFPEMVESSQDSTQQEVK